jgi:predicted transcriptional regulator
MMADRRKTLTEVRMAHKITIQQLAEKAGLPNRTIYVAGISGATMPLETISAIFAALKDLTGISYSLMDIAISIKKEEPEGIRPQSARRSVRRSSH